MTGILVIGGGPAGLMAAEAAATGGAEVIVVDHMPSVGRKLLMAGRGGLNLTHDSPVDTMVGHYGSAATRLEPFIDVFPPVAVRAWCEGLGQPVFVGTSGRVFPRAMKASPLLRAWLIRLNDRGVRFAAGRRWLGWDGDALILDGPAERVSAAATVLALGGASWPRLGSDGRWVELLGNVPISPFRPSNCGFSVGWSDEFRNRFAGTPVKRIAASFGGETVRGEAMVTASGIEGGAIYALSARLRDAAAPVLTLDLRPDLSAVALAERLDRPRGANSLSTFLRKTVGLAPVAVGLVQEALHAGAPADLATLIKALPLPLGPPFPLARAISTAGGVAWSAVDDTLMLRSRPGVFLAGEMLDWEAPTGGYLLQAAFATGRAAGLAALAWSRAHG